MKRLLLTFLFVLFFCISLPLNCSARDETDYGEIYSEVDEATRELLSEAGIDDVDFDELVSLSPKKVVDVIVGIFKGNMSVPLKTAGIACALIIVFSIIKAFSPEGFGSGADFAVNAAVISAVSVPLCESLSSAASSVKLVSDFMLTYIPIFTGVVSASGQSFSAFSYSGGMLLFAEALEKISSVYLLPIIMIFTVINIFSLFSENTAASDLIKTAKRIITVLLSVLSGLFVGFVTLKGSLAAGADSLAVKGIKLLSGSVIPIVGSALGEAVSSVLGSFSLIKSAVGAFGIIVILLTVLPSVIRLLLWYFSISVCVFLSDALGCASIKRILEGFLSLVSLVNVITVLCASVFIISTGTMLNLGS